jgi:hypothetical protein
MKSVWFYRSAKMNEHMKLKYSLLALAAPLLMNAQQVMTPEILWTLKKLEYRQFHRIRLPLFIK